jgi:hypothetical protein
VSQSDSALRIDDGACTCERGIGVPVGNARVDDLEVSLFVSPLYRRVLRPAGWTDQCGTWASSSKSEHFVDLAKSSRTHVHVPNASESKHCIVSARRIVNR